MSFCLLQLFVNQGGGAVDSSNAAKIFKAVWLAAMGATAEVPALTAGGVRYGTCIAMAGTEHQK